MRLRFFVVPAFDSETAEAELNRFLGSHRVLTVDRQLIEDGSRSAWAICVCYTEANDGVRNPARGPGGGPKIDYREVLNEADFAVFVRLRELRKRIADSEKVPAYALFTNEQLASMARGDVRSKESLAALDGVGPARVRKYGDEFLALLGDLLPKREADDEPSDAAP